jgi:osmotically-inducible protein OsmY
MVRTKHVLTAVLVLTASLMGCASPLNCGSSQCMSDEKITSNAEAELKRHPDLGPPDHISVQTRDGVVYLSGSVSAGEQGRTAEAAVAALPGVKRVVNSIYVTK